MTLYKVMVLIQSGEDLFYFSIYGFLSNFVYCLHMSSIARPNKNCFLWFTSRTDWCVVYSCPVSCLLTTEHQLTSEVFRLRTHREEGILPLDGLGTQLPHPLFPGPPACQPALRILYSPSQCLNLSPHTFHWFCFYAEPRGIQEVNS